MTLTRTEDYGYDESNRLTTVDYGDGQTMVRELQTVGGALTPAATYLTGPRGMEYRRDDGTGVVKWYVYDGLGSVVGELDPAGNLTCGKKYDVYGAERSGGMGTASSRQGFCGGLGHVSDAETGLVYMRARYYDPNVGRFVSEDPKGSGDNWLIYCNANPVNAVDTDGKEISYLFDFALAAFLFLGAWCAFDAELPLLGCVLVLGAAAALAIGAYDAVTSWGMAGTYSAPVRVVEDIIDTTVSQLKQSGGVAGAISGHLLELEFACDDVDLQ